MPEVDYKKHLYVLIICGGGGTRLWPRSRKATPKQFLANFFGKETIFTQTVKRAQLLTSNEKIFVITTADYIDEVITQAKIIPPRNIIAEPMGKNTAMAMGVAAAYIKKVDPEAIILNLYSDQLITDSQAFTNTALKAVEAASWGEYIVTVGLKPTYPHTGLGYIEAGEEIKPGTGVLKATAFKEKPDLETANKFLEQGNYYWNVGYYCWSAVSILNAYQKFSSDFYELIMEIYASIGTAEEEAVLLKNYEKARNAQIDTEISEKVDNKLLVTANFDWSDIGDWKVVYQLKPKDENQNVVEKFGDTGWGILVDSKNCLVETNKRLVAIVGVSDLVVVETEDALLVCHKDKAQDVKKVVEELKAKNKTEYL